MTRPQRAATRLAFVGLSVLATDRIHDLTPLGRSPEQIVDDNAEHAISGSSDRCEDGQFKSFYTPNYADYSYKLTTSCTTNNGRDVLIEGWTTETVRAELIEVLGDATSALAGISVSISTLLGADKLSRLLRHRLKKNP